MSEPMRSAAQEIAAEVLRAYHATDPSGAHDAVTRVLDVALCTVQVETFRTVAVALERVIPLLANPKVDATKTIQNIVAHMRKDAARLEASGKLASITLP